MKNLNEMTIIATALSRQDFMQKLVNKPVDMFFDIKNQTVFQAIKDLSIEHDIIDFPMVMNHLEMIGKKPDIEYIESYSKSSAALDPNAIMKQFVQRYNIKQGQISAERLFRMMQKGEIEDAKQLAQEIASISNDAALSDGTMFGEYSLSSLDDIFPDNYYKKTGIPALDRVIIGTSKGQFITVASEPGGGKTSLLWQMAKGQTTEGASFFSLEMDKSELYAKHLCSVSEVDIAKIESKKMTEDEFKRVSMAHKDAPKYFNSKLKVYDNTYNIFEIIDKIKDDKRINGTEIFFIDYFQLIEGPKMGNKLESYDFCSRILKQTARKEKVTIFVASQFNKESLKGTRPTANGIYGTGALHKDSDLILIIWFNEGIPVLSIDKGRKVKKGDIVDLVFKGQFQRFDSITRIPKGFDNYTTVD